MESIGFIISGILLLIFIFNIIFTHVSNAGRDRKNEYKDIRSRIEQLYKDINGRIEQLYKDINGRIEQLYKDINGRIEPLQVSIIEIKGEIQQIRKDIDNIENKQINLMQEIMDRRHRSDKDGFIGGKMEAGMIKMFSKKENKENILTNEDNDQV